VSEEGDWLDTNRAMLDERVPIDVAGEFYDVDGFLAGTTAVIDCRRSCSRCP
jgi:hypothetical protein